jgi:hypothetical protein
MPQQDTVPESLSLVAFKPTFCYAYLFNNFVWRAFGHGWLELAVGGKITPLAQKASSALSCSNFGNSHHQVDVKLEGITDYGQVVGSLIPLLSNPTASRSEELIVPIILLVIHDSSFKNFAGTASHMRGLMRLLMVCGPQRFREQPLRSAFETCRAMIITGMIVVRKRSYLESEAWRSIPWTLDPESKSGQNQLGDILVMVPGFLEDDDTLKERNDPGFREDLLERVEYQLMQLFAWRWKWQALHQSHVLEIPTIQDPQTSQFPLFPSTLHFLDFELATEISLYNAVQIWLIALLYKLSPTSAPSRIIAAATLSASQASFPDSSPSTLLQLPGSATSLRSLAIEIGRVFEYQCKHVHHSREAAYWYLFPMGLAFSVLEYDAVYRTWLRVMLDLSIVTKGYISPTGQNETGFGFYLSSEALRERLV